MPDPQHGQSRHRPIRRAWFWFLYVYNEIWLTFVSFVTLSGEPNPYEDWRTR